MITGRISGRFASVDAIASLPVQTSEGSIRLRDVAEVVDTEQDEKLRIRLDGTPGVKFAFQKQPQANTVAVVDAVNARLQWLREQRLIPVDVTLQGISDGAVFVRQAINNASTAAMSGALLAMLVVFIFLGDIRRTLIIGSSIPLGVMAALLMMDAVGLTLNVMTLGGIALGVGLLVDNTIVMLENTYRHQRMGKDKVAAAADAATEVNGALIASTTTSLVAVLPFLFVGGVIGLLFRELIATISAAILASLTVALTVVPALGARVKAGHSGWLRRHFDQVMSVMQRGYGNCIKVLLRVRWLVPIPFLLLLWFVWPAFTSGKQEVMPRVDNGQVRVYVNADSGISLNEMDATVARLERLFSEQVQVHTVYSQIGGFVFGRSERQATNASRLSIQLVNHAARNLSTDAWVKRMTKAVRELELAGVRVWMRPLGIRGLRIGRGQDDVSIRVLGPDLDVLAQLGDKMVAALKAIPGLRNVRHSGEDSVQELTVKVDRERASELGLSVNEIGRAVRIALQGVIATDFIEGDRSYDVRLRFPRTQRSSPRDIETIMLFPASKKRDSVYVGDVAAIALMNSPARILRDRQQRVVEVNARVNSDSTLGQASIAAFNAIERISLPKGYSVYNGGAADALERSEDLVQRLLLLAVFLVFVAMAVQYESLRNPFIILLGVPFAGIGVASGLIILELPLSMPMWLGIIMLTGIVVNNAIVLVEYIEQERTRGNSVDAAIIAAGSLRLRPILMTTLTTVVGMMPLALGVGEGAEMLQPHAMAIVWGLSFSMLVSLVLIPMLYRVFAVADAKHPAQLALSSRA